MQEAVPLGKGAMAAVIGLTPDEIVKICGDVSTEDAPVQAVNFNCPGQVVIAGEAGAVEKHAAHLKKPEQEEQSCLKSVLHSIRL